MGGAVEGTPFTVFLQFTCWACRGLHLSVLNLIMEDNTPDQTEDLDLSALSDEELVEQMHDDLYDGLKEDIEEGTNILLERGTQ
jgi:hypothetical protein